MKSSRINAKIAGVMYDSRSSFEVKTSDIKVPSYLCVTLKFITQEQNNTKINFVSRLCVAKVTPDTVLA